MSAARRGDRARLDGVGLELFELVREKATSEQWREWLRAPLEHAAAKGDMDLFTRLMDAGADGSAGWRGCDGRTLLGAAASGKSEEMVLALLDAGAKNDLNVRFGAKHESALHVAAWQGAEKVSSALMLAGADPNVLDSYNEGPLHRAAEAGHDGMVDILLLRGADPDKKTRFEGRTTLHLAAGEGHVRCVSKLLAGGADKDSRDPGGLTPLHLAARLNRLGVVEQLLAAGANIDIREETPFHWSVQARYNALDYAAWAADVGVVRALLRHGSSAKAADVRGNTALHAAAARAGSGDVIRTLLEAGAQVDATTSDKFCSLTPLYLAASTDSSGTISALLEGGADVNANFKKGVGTPLENACSSSCADAVEVLLRWGADEKLTLGDGATLEDRLGGWQRCEDSYYEDGGGCSPDGKRMWRERTAADQRIRRMLARAPTDRAWRRRGWLVLARARPSRVQLAQDSGGGGSGSSAKTVKTSCGGDGDRRRDESADLARLVGRVVGLGAESLFRLVVGFL